MKVTTMPTLQNNPTLADIQRYVAEFEQERGFSHQNVLQTCLLLGEEVGELFKAVRKSEGTSIDPASKTSTIADELADLVVMISAVANRSGVDLERAFRDKEEVNKQRAWTRDRRAS
jgi:NTP pyrophosphatase (non-canonical NTP hydrolase)